MSRLPSQQGIMPSLVDRLIDPEASGRGTRQGYDVQQAVDAVRRDLEDLLNSHLVYHENLSAWPELSNSILTYGMPDLASVQAYTAQQRENIGREIEATIARFEPRLRNVRARLVEGADKTNRAVRFHIEAELNMDPAPEVAFETVLELTTGRAFIKPREAEA